jgi:hypothetical protein
MKNLRVESTTDSELDCRVAEQQAYIAAPQACVVSCRSVQLEDGSTEHAPEEIQGGSTVIMPGRELRENMEAHNRRLANYKEECPDFDSIVGSADAPITTAVRDQILRMPNGPDVTFFLASYPTVTDELFAMHPLDAADYVEEISQALVRAKTPADTLEVSDWLRLRNENVERKRKTNAKRT